MRPAARSPRSLLPAPERRTGELTLPDGADTAAILELLRTGTLEPVGRLTTASNITLLCRVTRREGPPSVGGRAADDPTPAVELAPTAAGRAADGETHARTSDAAGPGGAQGDLLEATCVYKPVRGEAPLWDFPDGTLARREVAAYAVSSASGWDVVPPTVFRDGPFGPGMVQLWLDVDEEVDVVELLRRSDRSLRPMAVFDAVVNNADRKAGHILVLPGGAIRGVDHGVCFSVEPKLRTVLWNWMDAPLDEPELAVLRGLRDGLDGSLGRDLAALLDADEVAATAARIDALLASGRFPRPDPDWPAIPWPWY